MQDGSGSVILQPLKNPSNPRTYKGGVGGGCHPHIRFFCNFEKGIYAVVLTLSVAAHTSFAEILMYQLSVHDV